MHEWITTLGISVLTLLAFAGSVMGVMLLVKRTEASPASAPGSGNGSGNGSVEGRKAVPVREVTWVIALGALALYLHRWLIVRGDWQPLESHVDGLLLVVFLFVLAVIYLDRRARVPGIYAFALPLATVFLLWGICASWWTMEIFKIGKFVTGFHIVCVYLGTAFLSLAGVAGGMYLFVQKQLRAKKNLKMLHRLASLEALETLIVRASGIGFAVLTLGLVTGLIVVTSGPESKLGPGWWYSAKVLLAFGAWAVYAVVINLRHSTMFRGSRAAWLSILGVVLLFATFGAVTAMRGTEPVPTKRVPADQATIPREILENPSGGKTDAKAGAQTTHQEGR
jgi:ABC-type uncharacterized transport system permease subunit